MGNSSPETPTSSGIDELDDAALVFRNVSSLGGTLGGAVCSGVMNIDSPNVGGYALIGLFVGGVASLIAMRLYSVLRNSNDK